MRDQWISHDSDNSPSKGAGDGSCQFRADVPKKADLSRLKPVSGTEFRIDGCEKLDPLLALVAQETGISPKQTAQIAEALRPHHEELRRLTDKIVVGSASKEDWRDLGCALEFASKLPSIGRSDFLSSFFQLANLARSDQDVGLVLESAAICADYGQSQSGLLSKVVSRVLCLAQLEGEDELVSTSQALTIRLAHRAIDRAWSQQTLARVLATIPKDPTLEATRARLSLFDERFDGYNKFQVRNDFLWIASWERALSEQPDPAFSQAKDAILRSALRARLVGALVGLTEKLGRVPDGVHELIAQAGGEGIPSEQSILGLLHRGAPEGEVAAIARLRSFGIPLPLAGGEDKASLLYLYRETHAKLLQLQQPTSILDEVIKGLVAFHQRVASSRPESAPSAHIIPKLLRAICNEDEGQFEALVLSRVGREKLLVCLHGRGVLPGDAISQESDFYRLLTHLHAQHDVDQIIRTRDAEESLLRRKRFAQTFKIDNPPFSLGKTPKAEQVAFMQMTERVFARQVDSYLGAWANTYAFRHTPLTRRCQFDEFAAGVGEKLWVWPSNDIGRFPGRGRVLEGLDLTRVFAPPRGASDSDPLSYWKTQIFPHFGLVEGSRRRGNQHAMDNLKEMRVIALRGCFAFEHPSNPFFRIDDEPMSYFDFNHHFDPTGANRGFLVPSRAVETLLFHRLVYHRPGVDEFPFKVESADDDFPFSIQRIRDCAKEIGCRIGVVNLSSGSLYGGGLCNGLDPGSVPYFAWQHQHHQYKDGFGHPHKWNVQGVAPLLDRMNEVSRRIYEVATAYQNARDLYKIAFGIDAKGWSHRREFTGMGPPPSPKDEAIRRSFELDQGKASPAGRLQAEDAEQSFDDLIQQQDTAERDRERGRYMLDLFCDFVDECAEIRAPKDQLGVLVISNMAEWATAPETPVLLNARLGYAFRRSGRPVEIIDGKGFTNRRLLAEIWDNEIEPFLGKSENYWKAPRIVAEQNYVDQIKAMSK